ncbi:hypothetical protein [Actinophytocola sp.]|uniref:hypothetical protein n=1 Tax=Actinophytocola sp. TaxID=1872138 RepID=UPI003D6A5E76
MNEQELRHALRATMATTQAPPPMSEIPVLDAARQAARRRRAHWAGVGSAAAAVAVIGVAVVVVATTSGAGGPEAIIPATPPTSTTTSGGDKEPSQTQSWPNGQTDRTASSGPEFDRGVFLLAQLDAAVPAGYESPDDLVGTGDLAGAPMKDHQAQYADTVDGVEVWEYMADAAVTKGDRVGRLLAEVTTAGNRSTGEGCDLEPGLWGMEADDCTEVVVDGKRVGVFTAPTQRHRAAQFDQWAGYRHDDGTVVFVGQAGYRAFTNFPPLGELPLSARQLAELAADDRFHLD